MPLHPAPPTQGGSEDPRVFLDRLSGSWRYEDDEGDEWEWQPFVQLARPAIDQGEVEVEVEDDAPSTSTVATTSTSTSVQPTGHWVKVLDDELVRAQQAAYSVEGVDESQPAQPVLRRAKKRAASPSHPASSGSTNALPPSKRPKPITSLYVSGLPLDATADEIARVFSRYGVLLEDDQGKPRVKMYHDDKTGMFRGEALVVYFKPESVELAINMLDETNMRAAIGQTSSSGPIMRVQRAQFPNETASETKAKASTNASTKSTASEPSGTEQADSGKGTQTAGQRRNLSEQERKKIAKRVARLENKLSDWRDESDDSDDAHPSATVANGGSSSDAARIVVLTKMFTLFELEQDPTLLLDLKDDVRQECTDKIGGVTNVALWDLEPEGIMTVRFRTPDQAQKCVHMMHGRFFAQRRINAYILTGKPRFRKSTHNIDDDDHDNLKNHNFAQWLEKSST